MATTPKDEMNEQLVKQHHRMAVGAWVNGEESGEKGSATMPKANSDHGNIGSVIQKKNA
jgi:hypothetical protein